MFEMKMIIKDFYRKHYRFKSFKVLSRSACLGMNLIKKMGWEENCINHQKSRVDYTLNYNKKKLPRIKSVLDILKNKYIIGCIYQQRIDFFGYPKPDIIIIDSFSELTDQVFANKHGELFFANYSDVDSLLNNDYVCGGLLSVDDLYMSYLNFFKKVNEKYPGVKVIFIQFSTALDKRKIFQERAKEIEKVISRIQDEFCFLKTVKIDDAFVLKANTCDNEFNELPYHYSDFTYDTYLEAFKRCL